MRLLGNDGAGSIRRNLGFLLLPCIVFISNAAYGQAAAEHIAPSNPPAPAISFSAGLKPIVITARHRAERAQSVPISITTVDASQIKTVGSSNLEKLQQLVPSLTITSFSPRNTAVNIRGIGSVFVANDGLEGGVGTYLDGVLLARQAQDTFDLPDIQDIEILRGPQGTLFGKNTVAGAINITTRLPSFAPEAEGSVSYGSQNYVQLKASVSGAVLGSDKVAVRLTVQGTQHDGYIANTTRNQPYYNQNDKGVRAQILVDATPNLTVRVIFDYSEQRENCCTNLPDGIASGLGISATEGGILSRYAAADPGYALPTLNAFARKTDVDSHVFFNQETGGGSIQADYDLHGFTLTSISALRYWNWYPLDDGDDTALPILTAGNGTDYQRQASQELRLTSPLGGKVDYTAGLYYFYQSLQTGNTESFGSAAGAVFANSGSGFLYNAYNDALNGFTAFNNGIFDTNSLAGYGQATWHILPQLDLTGGLRYTYEAKTGYYSEVQQGGLPLGDVPAAYQSTVAGLRTAVSPITSYNVSTYNSLPAGLLTLSYKPTTNILAYATYSHGAKSAGINLVASPITPKVVAPETLDDYEAGLKTTLFGNRLLLDGDAFWEEDTDYQGTLVGSYNGTLYSYISSIPKVRSRGFEMDAQAQPTNNLHLFFSAAYDDAYYESNPKAPCPIELGGTSHICNLTGKPVAGVSPWSGSFGGEYDYPLPELRGERTIAYAGGNYALKNGFYSGADDSKYSFVPGYGIGNVDFGIKAANGAWDFSGWVHNFTNAQYYLYRGATGSFPTYNLIYAQVGDPISGGVTLSAKF